MANFTKKEIKNTVLGLLETMSIDRISVRIISEKCGINRNTFYYHFSDIPAVLEEIVIEQVDEIISKNGTIDSVDMAIKMAIDYAMSHKKVFYNIYNSSHRYIFEKSLMNLCGITVEKYFDTVFPDVKISEKDRELVINYYKCTSFGLVIDWLEKGMKDSSISDFERLAELRLGFVDEMLRKAEIK